MASVRVALRVRPLNLREVDLSCKCIINVDGSNISITNFKIPDVTVGDSARERTKTFTFDFSYDSSDGRRVGFASQEKVFQDLGSGVLLAAFQGYNACVFAYGQTGSGKSYTMMGTVEDRGLIPRICEGLFDRIADLTLWDEVSFCTEVSYLEIYNERVRDLLGRKSSGNYNLRVREHPRSGPYVEGLSKHLVQSYEDIMELLEAGNAKRTTACTGMNDTSSRSHAIFTIKFTQAKFGAEMPCETLSKIHLVDLAGSERSNASSSSGVRLKEGGSINRSLVTLGIVISALSDLSQDAVTHGLKKRLVFVPYRDSVLTWLLKDSLGGNSKTFMIATISPADINYGETLSTLRYASRAKNIINKPTVNEDASVKLIRELRAEIARLKALLAQAGSQITLLDMSTALSMEEKLHKNEARVRELTEEWTSKWSESQNILKDETLALRKEGSGVVLDSELPNLIGIDDDLLSTGVILYHLKEGRTCVGRNDSTVEQDIVLHGVDLESEHCVFENVNGVVILKPLGRALCFINGVRVTEASQLSQGVVVLLGRTNMFRFNHPKEAARLREKRKSGLLSPPGLSVSDVIQSGDSRTSAMFYSPRVTLEEMEWDPRSEKNELEHIQQEVEALRLMSGHVQLFSLKCQGQEVENRMLHLWEELERLRRDSNRQEHKVDHLEEQLREECCLLCPLKKHGVQRVGEGTMTQEEVRKTLLKSSLAPPDGQERLNAWCAEIDLQLKKLLQQERSGSSVFNQKKAHDLKFSAVFGMEEDSLDGAQERDVMAEVEQQALNLGGQLIGPGQCPGVVVEQDQGVKVAAAGGRPGDQGAWEQAVHGQERPSVLQRCHSFESDLLGQMLKLPALPHPGDVSVTKETAEAGNLKQHRERLMVDAEEAGGTNVGNDGESCTWSKSPLRSLFPTQKSYVPLLPSSSSCLPGTQECAAAVPDAEEGTQLQNKSHSPEESVCGNWGTRMLDELYRPEESTHDSRVEEGGLSKEGETRVAAEKRNEQKASPQKLRGLVLEMELLEVDKRFQAKSEQQERLMDLSGKGGAVRLVGGDATGSTYLGNERSDERSGFLCCSFDEAASHLGLGSARPDTAQGLSPSSVKVGERANNGEPVGDLAQTPMRIHGLQDCPLLESPGGQFSDAVAADPSSGGLVVNAQESATEDKMVCKDLGDTRSKGFGCKLAENLSWLYKGASSRLMSTKRAIHWIIEWNYRQTGRWYEQMHTIVKGLPAYRRVQLKVTVKSEVRETVPLSESLSNNLNYIREQNSARLTPTIMRSPGSTMAESQDVQSFCQKLVDFPLCLQELQRLSPQNMLTRLQDLIPETDCNSWHLQSMYWLRVANFRKPAPQPGCVLLFESVIYVVFFDNDQEGPEKALAAFPKLPLWKVREVHVGFAGQHVRLQGSTEDTVLTIYTHSKLLTQELCWALLRALSQTEAEAYKNHPLLQGDLVQLSLDWRSHTPDLRLGNGARLSCRFTRALTDLVYLLHGNMEEKRSLSDIRLLLYTSVRVEVSPWPRPDTISQFFLMDTHVGLVQEDGLFHPAPRDVAVESRRAHFDVIALRRLSDVRCVLVGDKDNAVRVDIVFKVSVRGCAEVKVHSKHNTAALPALSGYSLFPQSEMWKLTFSCDTEAALLINHLSTV